MHSTSLLMWVWKQVHVWLLTSQYAPPDILSQSVSPRIHTSPGTFIIKQRYGLIYVNNAERRTLKHRPAFTTHCLRTLIHYIVWDKCMIRECKYYFKWTSFKKTQFFNNTSLKTKIFYPLKRINVWVAHVVGIGWVGISSRITISIDNAEVKWYPLEQLANSLPVKIVPHTKLKWKSIDMWFTILQILFV